MFRLLRFLVRWFIRVTALAALVVIGLVLARDLILRQWLEFRFRHLTGLETRLGGVESHPGAGTLTLTDLAIDNAPEFGSGPLLRLPELHLELDGDALIHRELRLRQARIRLGELNVVRDARGRTNLFAVLEHAQAHAGPADAAVVAPPGVEFTGVETLSLSAGTLRLLDLGNPSANREISLRLTNEVLHNVRSAADFTPLILRILVRELSSGLQPRPPR